MAYKFSEDDVLFDNLALAYECPECPDEESLRPVIHFDKETVEIMLVDRFQTAG